MYAPENVGCPKRMSTTKETSFIMKRIAALIAALALTLIVTACDEVTPGVVNGIYGPEVTQATKECNLSSSWSITVDPDGHEGESIDARAKYRFRVCLSEAEAKSYKSGDRYPKTK